VLPLRGCARARVDAIAWLAKSRTDRRWKLQTGVGFSDERRAAAWGEGGEGEGEGGRGEGRENDVRAMQTKRNRCRQTGADGRGPEKEFELVRFSPWPLTIAIVSIGTRPGEQPPVAKGQKQEKGAT